VNQRAAAGRAAEQRALDYLVRQGLRLRARNYQCRWGEIDLIMETGAAIVFVEVRYRTSGHYGGAAASVDRRKRGRLLRTASHYLARGNLGHRPARFDVIAAGPREQIEWITGAFEAE